MNENYKELYIKFCANLNNCSSKEEVKIHNAAMKQLSKLYHEIENIEDKPFLLDLLNHDDAHTRSLVAAHCLGLGVYVSKAKKVLKVLTKNKTNPIIAFEAQATLDVWKQQGYLEF